MIKTKKIGVVGIGRMGANMARRLIDRGYKVSALFDIDSNLTQKLAAELNTTACTTLRQVSELAEIIITVVSDDAAMRSLFISQKEGLLTSAEGKIFINCATVSPEVHREVQAACEARGANSLEACMASSITQAREGTLYLMIGGKREVFERVEPLLQDLSKSLRYIGPAGKAAQVKALVNMVMNCNTAALAEGLGLGQALGLDLNVIKEVFSQTGANSRVLETDGDDMINRAHECYFSAAHAAKDSGIANQMARAVGCTVPLSQATEKQYLNLIELGRGELDKSAVAELTFLGRSKA